MIMREIKLTREILIKHGFCADGESDSGSPRFKIKTPVEYMFDLRIVLGNYKEGNPNNGIVSLYSAETEANAIPPDLYEKTEWTKSDIKRAKNYTVILPESDHNIAWHITTLEKLKMLYGALTHHELKLND